MPNPAKVLLQRVRNSPAANRVVRRRLVGAQRAARRVDWFADRWRIYGTPSVSFAGATFRMLGRNDDGVLDALYYGRPWEVGESRLFAALVKDAEVVFDLGANTGVYSLLSSALAPQARVIAVEPSPANAERLRANIALNAATTITVVEAAVGDREGSVEIATPADGSISDVASAVEGFSSAFYGQSYRKHTVTQTTVDALVAQHDLGRVDLIKLDVEYFELQVLRGATETLREFSPIVIAEVFDYEVLIAQKPELRDRIPADHSALVEQLMSSLGYTFFAIGEDGILRVPSLGTALGRGSNYLFVKDPPDVRYIPYSDERDIQSLLRGARTP